MSQEKKQPEGQQQAGPPMGRPVVKAKNFMGTLKRLIRYLMPQKFKFFAVFVLAILSTVFSIVGPKMMGNATTKIADGVIQRYMYIFKLQAAISSNLPQSTIDSIRNQSIPLFDFGYIKYILIIMLLLYIISSLCAFVMSYIMADVSQKTVFTMRNDVKEKFDRLPLKYFDSHTHGEVLSRITNDMDNIATTLQQSLTQLITSIATIIGIVIMMLSISPLLTLVALVSLVASGRITMYIAKKSQKYFSGQQKSIGSLNGHVEEMYTGHKIIKAFGREKDSIKKFKEINSNLYEVSWKAQFMSGIIFPALNFVSNLAYVAICVLGGIMVTKKAIEVGDIQAFIQYMRSFTMPIVQTANIANVIQSTVASAERVFEVLDEPEELADIEDFKTIDKPKGEVVFDHVKFGYTEEILIQDMNIDVRPGMTIAIVGPTGAGKTTLINLLMRFYEISGGEIRIDGVNITNLKRGDLRKMFGMVLQETWLFKGSIMDNIAYGREDATKEEVILAAKAANAHHFIKTLPDGYNTVLNEEATNISQGQKQLLTIARAILANPSILILDEATSNVDTRTEILIQKAMAKLMEGRTSFVIAHRLSTIKNADLIIVMNKGSIMEQGTHNELLNAKGFYSDLYNSQFSEGD